EDDGVEVPEAEREALAQDYRRDQAATWSGDVLGLDVVVARGLAKGMSGDIRLFRAGDLNSSEVTLRKQGQITGRRGQLPTMAVEPRQNQPELDDLVELLDEESISMVYQPVVDIRSEPGSAAVVGYEAYARFPYSSPTEWFRLAGASGVGPELELLALRAGIAGFSTRDDDSFLALNLSNATLLASGLDSALEGIDPGRLVLELSDTARIRSYEVTRKAVESLREHGVRLAVDDVGAGEIDMWHILRLDPELIKLDRHLVADQENTRRNNALIRGLTTMARDLGIMVIAEAIETEGERNRLLELGVEFGQGYLFGKPEPLQWKSRVLGNEADPLTQAVHPAAR
ncbi:MAG TPA: EAL domain-containing protein, partial [Acidimicrobiia bacterium]|nr:EAL domain-containing protein [Acidimicrobiia bacterium]